MTDEPKEKLRFAPVLGVSATAVLAGSSQADNSAAIPPALSCRPTFATPPPELRPRKCAAKDRVRYRMLLIIKECVRSGVQVGPYRHNLRRSKIRNTMLLSAWLAHRIRPQ